MIKINQNNIFIRFGNGDIGIGNVENTKNKTVGIILMNTKQHKIGTNFDIEKIKEKQLDSTTYLIFENLESLKIFEEYLIRAKERLIKVLKNE